MNTDRIHIEALLESGRKQVAVMAEKAGLSFEECREALLYANSALITQIFQAIGSQPPADKKEEEKK